MVDAFHAALARASQVDPTQAAEHCGIGYTGDETAGVFDITFLGERFALPFPAFDSHGSLPPHVAAIVMYHLATSDGTIPTERWITLAGLPEGAFYVSAFRGYTGQVLTAHFGDRVDDVAESARLLGGSENDLPGDATYTFEVMPRVPVALQYWHSDDEFEARADLLFDEVAPHHLVTDCYAVLGSWLTNRLIKGDPGGSHE